MLARENRKERKKQKRSRFAPAAVQAIAFFFSVNVVFFLPFASFPSFSTKPNGGWLLLEVGVAGIAPREAVGGAVRLDDGVFGFLVVFRVVRLMRLATEYVTAGRAQPQVFLLAADLANGFF